jgi:hypothetical protein
MLEHGQEVPRLKKRSAGSQKSDASSTDAFFHAISEGEKESEGEREMEIEGCEVFYWRRGGENIKTKEIERNWRWHHLMRHAYNWRGWKGERPRFGLIESGADDSLLHLLWNSHRAVIVLFYFY